MIFKKVRVVERCSRRHVSIDAGDMTIEHAKVQSILVEMQSGVTGHQMQVILAILRGRLKL